MHKSEKAPGSAPRVRGTRCSAAEGWRFPRFSPACAGNTRAARCGPGRLPVQPRVCGEHLKKNAGLTCNIGSAPRVRGTPWCAPENFIRDRFSPACAGNTRGHLILVMVMAVQPRVCGEHVQRLATIQIAGGSAPRVRGTPWRDNPRGGRVRFSPACAGNTLSIMRVAISAAVQPRVCGEHAKEIHKHYLASGSAPRVRGTLNTCASGMWAGRFSPACAGNTARMSSPIPIASVQPRVCGEHARIGYKGRVGSGSAPRVRGTPGVGFTITGATRFSPACAGNTARLAIPARHWAVQPRVCGEHGL